MPVEPSAEDAATLADSVTPTPSAAPPRPRRDTQAADDERYDLGPVLGRGGMGEVRLAHDVRIDRDVAVKLMHPHQRDDATVARFFREARVQGQLEHPAVVPVHDLGIDGDGNPYFVMKRVTGTTLLEVLGTADAELRARWPRRTLLARFVDVCLAVEFAHTRGVVHRDLKPANIMLGDFGEVNVIDWGLARVRDDAAETRAPSTHDEDPYHTVAGALLGTPGYMSPEQARGDAIDARTDVYALGCILYELVAGAAALPRGVAGIQATLAAPDLRPSTRPSAVKLDAPVPPELDDACAAATAADRDARPTARALGQAVQAYLDGDRDLERRRALATIHVDAARAALAAAAAPAAPGARARAMREAGRALALDASNADAASLVARLLLDAPAALPAEAIAASDLARARVTQGLMRGVAASYLFIAATLLLMFTFSVRHGAAIFALQGVCVACAAAAAVASRKLYPARAPIYHAIAWLNGAALFAGSICFSPLLVMPVFVIGTLSAGISLPTRMPVWAMVIPTLVAVVAPLLLEAAEITPSTFHVDGHGLVFTPWAVELSPNAMMFVVLAGMFSMTLITIGLSARQRTVQQSTEDRLHATTWHLEQLLPAAQDRAQDRSRPAK